MTWGMIGAAAVTTVGGAMMNSGGGSGGGGGQQYVGHSMGPADDTWTNAMHGSYDLTAGARDSAMPGFQQSFNNMNGLSYGSYLDRMGQAGGAYGQVGDTAMSQMAGYGQRAGVAAGQQDMMYGAGGQVLQTAFDPQNALYDRTAQHTQDQIRAGQAARGLGNSEAGMMEEAGAMSNFNIDWQNAQLGRQATGIQAAGQATGAGNGAGQLYGADQSAGLTAGAAGAGYYGQAGQVPMTAQEYAAGAPGRNSAQLVGNYGSLQQMYGNAQSGIIPYLNSGNGAIQGNYQNAYQNNRDQTAALSQIGGAVAPSVAGWFAGSGAQPYNPQTQTGGWSGTSNAGFYYGTGGVGD